MGRVPVAGLRRTTDDGPAARRRPRAEPQDPVVFGVLMAFAIGVACVLTLEPTTCPYGARQLLARASPGRRRIVRRRRAGPTSTRPYRTVLPDAGNTRTTRTCSSTIRIKARARRMATPVKTWRRSSQRPKVSWRVAITGKRPNDAYFLEALTGHVANGSSVFVIGSAEPLARGRLPCSGRFEGHDRRLRFKKIRAPATGPGQCELLESTRRRESEL